VISSSPLPLSLFFEMYPHTATSPSADRALSIPAIRRRCATYLHRRWVRHTGTGRFTEHARENRPSRSTEAVQRSTDTVSRSLVGKHGTRSASIVSHMFRCTVHNIEDSPDALTKYFFHERSDLFQAKSPFRTGIGWTRSEHFQTLSSEH